MARILVVDDDADCRGTICTRLRGVGFEVVEADNGKSALDRLRESAFDVAVLDIMMPGLDGFSVMEHVKSMPEPPGIIFVSAMGAPDNRIRGLYAGAADYITKPFDPRELVARVSTAVRGRRELREAVKGSLADELTGLGNRRAFDEVIRRETVCARRFGRPLVLVYLDADGLKEVNDRFGHACGDEFLRCVADAIRKTCRQSDLASRIGGDEFAILLPETEVTGVDSFLDRLRVALASSPPIKTARGTVQHLSVSAGYAIWRKEMNRIEDFIQIADDALYAAKQRRTAMVA